MAHDAHDVMEANYDKDNDAHDVMEAKYEDKDNDNQDLVDLMHVT